MNAIKERRDPVASAETGHRTATVCHLGNIARWVSGITGETGQKLKWDAATERFTNSDEANQFIRPPHLQRLRNPGGLTPIRPGIPQTEMYYCERTAHGGTGCFKNDH